MLNKKKDVLLKDDCLFCKIIKGEIPCYKIYEDENSLAFLDIAEDYYGHTLIIPKNHCTNLYDADSNQILSVMQTVQKIIKHYKQLGFEGANVLISNESCAEQCVFHLHVHVIPRKLNDGLKIFPTNSMQNYDLKSICDLLKIN